MQSVLWTNYLNLYVKGLLHLLLKLDLMSIFRGLFFFFRRKAGMEDEKYCFSKGDTVFWEDNFNAEYK